MIDRLDARLEALRQENGTRTRTGSAIAAPTNSAAAPEVAVEEVEAIAAIAAGQPTESAANGSWPDESAETAFLAEARDRGETVAPAKAREEIPDETDPKALPPLDELVQRIPVEVRDVLDDLFRAKFTKVRRIPAKALKSQLGGN